MSLPHFTAEASLGRARNIYRGVAAAGDAGTGDVLPAQGGFAGGHPALPEIRCCRWAPRFGRFVCTSRRQRPGEQCRCVSSLTGPVILCEDLVVNQSQF